MIDTDRLKQAVNELDHVTTALNGYLESIEKELQEIGPGLVVWVFKGNDKNVQFGYYRFHEGWHLAVRVKDEEPKPILRAARYYRYACYTVRQQIVDALYEASMSASNRWKKGLEGIEPEIPEIEDGQTEP